MTSLDLASALNDLIAQAAPAVPVQAAPSLEDAFAALLAGTTPDTGPRQPIHDPLTGGILAFVSAPQQP